MEKNERLDNIMPRMQKRIEKEAEKDKKYKVVLSPSFPGEYRAVFEDILKELEKNVENNENKA